MSKIWQEESRNEDRDNLHEELLVKAAQKGLTIEEYLALKEKEVEQSDEWMIENAKANIW